MKKMSTNSNIDFFKIKSNNIKPEKGKILISEPLAQGFYFKRSVVILTEYNSDGAMGFVLNKPVNKPIPEINEDFPDFEPNISVGGPMSTDSMYYVHTLGNKILPGSIEISKGLFWGGNYSKIKKLINSNQINSNQIRFFIGYSGWTAQQLDEELKNNFWLVENLQQEKIMTHSNEIWKEVLLTMGPRYQMWANFPENPKFN